MSEPTSDEIEKDAIEYRDRHNLNQAFYTLSPWILPVIANSYLWISQKNPSLLKNCSYYEFGVFKGFSLWYAEALARSLNLNGIHFFGFDSFAGLPEEISDNVSRWKPGTYTASFAQVNHHLKQNNADFGKIELVKGFYSKDLFLEFEEKFQPRPPAIAVFDMDLYESCKAVLDFFGHKFPRGCILIFDDYFVFRDDSGGERRALSEYQARNPSFQLKKLWQYPAYGQVFQVL